MDIEPLFTCVNGHWLVGLGLAGSSYLAVLGRLLELMISVTESQLIWQP